MASPTADVRLNVAANSAAAQYDMLAARMKSFMRSVQNETNRTGQNAKKASEGFGGWAGGIQKATTAMLGMGVAMRGVQSAMDIILQQLQQAVEISNLANQRQVPYEARLKQIAFQSVPASVKNPEGFMGLIDKKIMDSSVADNNQLAQLVQTSISTMGNADPMERVNFAIKFAEARRDF